MTKEDIDLLTEYMYVMEPVAKILDILHGEKDVFMGIGVVLPLLTKLKQELTLREFPNLEPNEEQGAGIVRKMVLYS